MSDRTLILIKPDGVRRGLIGTVISRLERKGLRIVAMDLRTLDEGTAQVHYAEHVGKPFFEPLIEFITSGRLVALVAEGQGPSRRSGRSPGRPIRWPPRRAPSGGTTRCRLRRTSCTARTRRSRPREKSRSSSRSSPDGEAGGSG